MADKFEEDAIMKQRQQLHMTVFSQCFSPCGKFLVTGNNFGRIAVFSLVSALSPDIIEDCRKPILSFQGSSSAIYSLIATDKFLICGGEGDINAWNWSDIYKKTPKVAWSLSVPVDGYFNHPETNCLSYQEKDNLLYSGCGDSNVYVWDLESGTRKNTLKGHKDYIHCLTSRYNGQELMSGSEDGSVRVWDTRTSSEAVHVIEPFKHQECSRPNQGKWIGCIAVDSSDDWMVCGGGPTLTSWHMRSLTPTVVFPTPNICQKHVMFHEDTIISGGTCSNVYHWTINGDMKSCVPCTPTSVYSIAINTHSENNRVLSTCGSGYKVDIFTNFGYRAFSLLFS
ncbi:THO complex subunit 6 homolog [Saccoglossus kowalevskii]|uniref:THO complex subunit 6 homolog n=1 Tax=Saccoglossus kowalevskii TaxID=10224 RepID=A0ABM0GXD3_SACKO|nr:PREDICTED: THO complex subunit 6 homolog [Saccoglossus kowalevskii]